jgi:hypothetical protein
VLHALDDAELLQDVDDAYVHHDRLVVRHEAQDPAPAYRHRDSIRLTMGTAFGREGACVHHEMRALNSTDMRCKIPTGLRLCM